jgi:hypothetical protein
MQAKDIRKRHYGLGRYPCARDRQLTAQVPDQCGTGHRRRAAGRGYRQRGGSPARRGDKPAESAASVVAGGGLRRSDDSLRQGERCPGGRGYDAKRDHGGRGEPGPGRCMPVVNSSSGSLSRLDGDKA